MPPLTITILNGSCLFAAGLPTDTVGSLNFQTFFTRQAPHLGDWWGELTTTRTLVLPRLTFKPLLSKAFNFKNLFLSPSIILLIRTKSSTYSNSFSAPSGKFRDSIHHHCKKKRWQHRLLVHPHFNLKLLWQIRVLSDSYLCSLIQTHHWYSQYFLIVHANTFLSTLTKAFSSPQNTYTTFFL